MPDIAAISTILTSIKAATDIARFIRESDVSIERAELKLKLADLVSALADAKMQAVDVQDELTERGRRIKELEEALETKAVVVRHYDGYYKINAVGQATGRAYCLSCWDQHHKLRELVQDHGDRSTNKCASCGHKYPRRLTLDLSATVQEPEA